LISAAINIVATVLFEYYSKELRQIPLAENNVGIRISGILENICD
jgi:hypothetical protein